MREWQTIETAPKDGTPFLGCWATPAVPVFNVIRWSDEYECWSTEDDGSLDGEVKPPTHWTPLPEPPAFVRMVE